jgi:nucleoside-diphosphate-sugar epimerase
MKCLVTGAAGFIGSHLCERLLRDGHDVVGVDGFIPYYPRSLKEANLRQAQRQTAFEFQELDLRNEPLDDMLDGVEVVFHLAANAGLPRSWTQFDLYESCNVAATQRLLAASIARGVKRFINVSTSSVYGRHASGDETLPTRPISPYGVTKLAAEQLCRAYAEELGLPLVVLRYFSVYGPRQRPDMGYYKFIDSLLTGSPITVHGDGQQIRGNTFISDCVEATVRAIDAPLGETYNVGGGETASVWDILHKLEKLTRRKAIVVKSAARAGDQRSTCADTSKIMRDLGWRPRVSLDEGLALQVDWQAETVGSIAAAA